MLTEWMSEVLTPKYEEFLGNPQASELPPEILILSALDRLQCILLVVESSFVVRKSCATKVLFEIRDCLLAVPN